MSESFIWESNLGNCFKLGMIKRLGEKYWPIFLFYGPLIHVGEGQKPYYLEPKLWDCLKLTNTNIENDKKAVDQFLFCGPLLHVGGQVWSRLSTIIDVEAGPWAAVNQWMLWPCTTGWGWLEGPRRSSTIIAHSNYPTRALMLVCQTCLLRHLVRPQPAFTVTQYLHHVSALMANMNRIYIALTKLVTCRTIVNHYVDQFHMIWWNNSMGTSPGHTQP